MEKTLARAIYKRMEIGKEYTTRDIFRILDDEQYKYIPVEHHRECKTIVVNELWKIVKAGFATTIKRPEEMGLVRGHRFGSKNIPIIPITVRYWKRVK